jgi:hypothetical protein
MKMKGTRDLLALTLWIIAALTGCQSIHLSSGESTRIARTEDFNVFINRFKSDSTFQHSRIQFPLTQEFRSDVLEAENIIRRIESPDWRFLPLHYDESFAHREMNAYKEVIIIEKNTARLMYHGVDNGINVEFIFESIDGHWYLIRWNDFST